MNFFAFFLQCDNLEQEIKSLNKKLSASEQQMIKFNELKDENMKQKENVILKFIIFILPRYACGGWFIPNFRPTSVFRSLVTFHKSITIFRLLDSLLNAHLGRYLLHIVCFWFVYSGSSKRGIK